MRTLLAVLALGALGAQAAPSTKLGSDLYAANCAGCHGQKAQGGVGPKLAGDAAGWKYDLFKRAVLRGVDDHGKQLGVMMPRWGQTGFQGHGGKTPTDDEVKSIQLYLKGIR